jgi:hypothetical protein
VRGRLAKTMVTGKSPYFNMQTIEDVPSTKIINQALGPGKEPIRLISCNPENGSCAPKGRSVIFPKSNYIHQDYRRSTDSPTDDSASYVDKLVKAPIPVEALQHYKDISVAGRNMNYWNADINRLSDLEDKTNTPRSILNYIYGDTLETRMRRAKYQPFTFPKSMIYFDAPNGGRRR